MNTAQTIARRAPIYARAALRLTIAAGVLAGCILVDCAVLAYDLGRLTGAAVHARNDQLAALAVRMLAPSAPAAPAPVATAAPEPEPTPAPVATAEPAPYRVIHATTGEPVEGVPAFATFEDAWRHKGHLETADHWLAIGRPAPAPRTLESLTVRELRELTGCRSKRDRKADLVAMARAMA
jgi:hypothetical protein